MQPEPFRVQEALDKVYAKETSSLDESLMKMQLTSFPKEEWGSASVIDRENTMRLTGLMQKAQFVVDASGNKKAVLLDYAAWEELLTLLEDLEDAEEIRQFRDSRDEEAITWEQAKEELHSEGIDV